MAKKNRIFVRNESKHEKRTYVISFIIVSIFSVIVWPLAILEWLENGENKYGIFLFILIVIFSWYAFGIRFWTLFKVSNEIELTDNEIIGIPYYTRKKNTVRMNFEEIDTIIASKKGIKHIFLTSNFDSKKILKIPMSIMGKPALFRTIKKKAVNCKNIDIDLYENTWLWI